MIDSNIYSDERFDEITIKSLIDYIEVIINLPQMINNYFDKKADNRNIEALILGIIKKELDRKGDSFVKSNDKLSLNEQLINLEKKNREITNPKTIVVSPRKLYYRGESNCFRPLLPSVYRQNANQVYELKYEDYYYKQIKTMCPEVFAGKKTHLEHLVTMQHYGCHTRLLDITSNPLVALYFACNSKTDKDGIVYVFDPIENEVKPFDSDKVLNLASLAPFNNSDKDSIYEETIKKLVSSKKFDSPNNGDVIERFYHEIRTEKPAYAKKLEPIDLLTPLFVQPLRDNRRIEKQDGAFIIAGLTKNQNQMQSIMRKMVWKAVIIPGQYKSRIINELNSVGINRATLFPEIESVAEYLTSSKKVEWNHSQ